MFKLASLISMILSTLCLAEGLPVDQEIQELRAKAAHLETLKELFQAARCKAVIGQNEVALSAGALRGNGLIMGVTDSMPGQYVGAFHSAPKPEHLKNVLISIALKPMNRVFIVSSSLESANGTEFTHLAVKLAEPVLSKDILDPQTHKPTYVYQTTYLSLSLDTVKKGGATKVASLAKGGSFQVVCQ